MIKNKRYLHRTLFDFSTFFKAREKKKVSEMGCHVSVRLWTDRDRFTADVNASALSRVAER